MDKLRPFKLMLRDKTANTLDHIAADLKVIEGNYQIGVGTIAARLLESLVDHPELIQQLLAEYARKAGQAVVDTVRDIHEDTATGFPPPPRRRRK